jgi:hypothetical protein
LRKFKILPCSICGNTDIKEYMIDKTHSYMTCDSCKIVAPAKNSHFQAVAAWNEIMRYYSHSDRNKRREGHVLERWRAEM